MRIISEIDVSGKVVFMRADLDVPLDDGYAEVGTRLINLKETTEYLLKNGAKVIIAGHIDRPQKPDPALSTRLLLLPLKQILAREIIFREEAGQKVDTDLTLFENLRFWPGEASNDPKFAQEMAAMADIYVNEAFGNCHRNHASMVALPNILPHLAGFHLAKEITELSKILNTPQHPFVAIVGGAKIDTKLPIIENLAKIADIVLVGGELPVEIERRNSQFPPNVKVAGMSQDNKEISEHSVSQFTEIIKGAKTIIWNGPLGLFEEGYSHATLSIANAIVKSGAHSVVGGGETTQFLVGNNLISKFSFVSAGGGAMLEFLAGKELPGVTALS